MHTKMHCASVSTKIYTKATFLHDAAYISMQMELMKICDMNFQQLANIQLELGTDNSVYNAVATRTFFPHKTMIQRFA